MASNPMLAALDHDLVVAIDAGGDDAVHQLAEQFDTQGLGVLATVLRHEGSAGLRQYLDT